MVPSSRLKQAALVLWSSGMTAAMFDLLAFPVMGVRAPLSYLFFGGAALLVFLAEVRQHTLRFALYRVHDLLMYSPWKYLVLYFLWISLFAAFTIDPAKSLLYASTGWFSLLAVGLGGTLLFFERDLSGPVLVVSRLQLPFFAWAAGLLVLQGNYLLHIPFPLFPLLHDDPVSFHLYFLMGVPFLLWDFLHRRRRFLSRWLSGAVLATGAATLLLSGRRFFWIAMAAGAAAYVAVAVYKRARLRSLPALALAALAAAGLFWSMKWIPLMSEKREAVLRELVLLGSYYEERLGSQLRVTGMVLEESRWLGTGLGLADLRGVWARVPAEAGVPGVALYFLFFVSLLIRRCAPPSPRMRGE
ncbi:MAG: hypothetical protein HUU37_08300, partial [Bdellovibrionales bacterium]|nr:hypothetical protein [Bdellovibrionales bacterium]